MAGLLALFSSCSKDVANRLNPEALETGDGIAVIVNFPGRTLVGSDGLRAGTVAAQDYEQALQAGYVFFYVFEDDGTGQPGKLKRIEPVGDLGNGVPESGVTGKVFFRDNGKLHVVPTANLRWSKDQRDALLGKTFVEVSKTLVTQLAGEANWFPMVGEPVVIDTSTLGSTSGTLSFNLERLSARIDLVNETSTAKGGRFELTGARLRRGDIDRSFMMKGQSPALKVGDATYGAVALTANLWIERDATKNSDSNHMWMQLYTYENEPGELWIEVKGTFEGVKAEFMLPFTPAVKRNTLYRVAIRNTKTTDVPIVDPNNPPVDPSDPTDPNHPDNPTYPTNPAIEPAIRAIDWDEGGVATLEPTQDKTQPIITYFAASDVSGAPATKAHTEVYGTTGDVNTIRSLKLNGPNAYTMKLTLKSKGAEPMVLLQKADVPWVKVEPLGKTVISTEGLMQDYLVTFGANADLFPRTAELEIQNRYFPDKITPRTIKVEQPKAATTMNQLAYWAKANVDELNTFATEVTEENAFSPEVIGKFYQWGRNVPFAYDDPNLIVTTTKSNGNDALLWDNKKFIAQNAYGTDWFDLAGGTVKTWVEMVAKATSAPASYVGNNGGDPSPVGYRLPTYADCAAIFPVQRLRNAWDGGIALYGGANTLTLRNSGAEVQYVDDYYSKDRNVVYAIKLKGGDNAAITAYRYEYRGQMGLKITARHLGSKGASLDVKSIANPSYWESEAGSDVVRIFPTTGLRLSSTGVLIQNGVEVFNWASGRNITVAATVETLGVIEPVRMTSYGHTLRPVLR